MYVCLLIGDGFSRAFTGGGRGGASFGVVKWSVGGWDVDDWLALST